MLDITSKGLHTEVTKATEFRDKHLSGLSDRIRSYHGPAYTEDSDDFDPENHYYEFISLYVPRTVFDNPQVKVSTTRPGAQQDIAEAVGHGLNRWIKDVSLRHTLDQIAYDYFMSWGVSLTVPEPRIGIRPQETVEIITKNGETRKKEVAVHWPQVYRISPKRFFIDPVCEHINEARYQGHTWIRDKDALIKEAEKNPDKGWNLQSIKDLAENAGVDDLRDTDGRKNDDGPDRGEIACHEIWIPEHQTDKKYGPEKGYHGTIFTIAVASGSKGETKSEEIRKPRPYYGPKWGPYTAFGTYTVPDQPYPLSILVAVDAQTKALNDHVRAGDRNADRYKRLVLVDAGKPEEAQKIAEDPDAYVIPVTNLDATKFKEVEIGGISNQHLLHIEQKRERLDRVAGMHDAQRGVVTGKGTATEVQEASETSDTRAGYIQARYQDGVTQILKTVAWYLYHDDRVIFPLGSEAAQALGMEEGVDPIYFGGIHAPGSGATFADLELTIEAHSMQRSNEALEMRRTMEGSNFVLQTAPLIPETAHFIDWAGIYKDVGNALNIPHLGSRVKIPPGGFPDPTENEPRYSKDSGVRGSVTHPVRAREMLGKRSGQAISGSIAS